MKRLFNIKLHSSGNLDKVTKQVNMLSTELMQLDNELETVCHEKDSHQERINILNSKRSIQEQKIESLNELIAKNELEIISNIEQERELLKDTSNLELEIVKTVERSNEKELVLNGLALKTQQRKEELELKTNNLTSIKNELSNTSSEVLKRKLELKECEDQKKSVDLDLAKYKDSLKSLLESLDEINEDIDTSTKAKDKLTLENSKLVKELGAISSVVKRKKEILASIKKEEECLNLELNKKREKITSFNDSIQDLDEEIEDSKIHLSKKLDELIKVKKGLELAQKEHTENDAEAQLLIERLEVVNSELEASFRLSESLEETLSESSRNRKKLENEEKEFLYEIESKELQIKELSASISEEESLSNEIILRKNDSRDLLRELQKEEDSLIEIKEKSDQERILLKEVNSEIEESTRLLEQKTNEVQEYKSTLVETQDTLELKNAELSNKRIMLNEYLEELSELQQSIKENVETISNQDDELNTSEMNIVTLETQVQNEKERLEKLSQQIEEKKKKIAVADNQIRNHKKNIRKLQLLSHEEESLLEKSSEVYNSKLSQVKPNKVSLVREIRGQRNIETGDERIDLQDKLEVSIRQSLKSLSPKSTIDFNCETSSLKFLGDTFKVLDGLEDSYSSIKSLIISQNRSQLLITARGTHLNSNMLSEDIRSHLKQVKMKSKYLKCSSLNVYVQSAELVVEMGFTLVQKSVVHAVDGN